MGGDWEMQDPETDTRFQWIRRQVQHGFRNIKPDGLNSLEDHANQQIIFDFLDGTCSTLTFYEQNGALEVATVPSRSITPLLYMVKLSRGLVQRKDLQTQIMIGKIEVDPFLHLGMLSREVFGPLISNVRNHTNCSDLISKDIVRYVQNFQASINIQHGRTKGLTCLPLPAERDVEDVPDGSKGTIKRGDSDLHLTATGSSSGREKVHIIEGFVITWTKQIKDVLRQEPETVLDQAEKHPGPLAELNFWQSKAENLNFIFHQLQSEKFRKILKILDQSKSSYNVPFAKLCKSLFVARSEANENHKFLQPLRPWFEKLEGEIDFPDLTEVFRPIIHLLLLIWKGSRFFNTSTRLVFLLRRISNALIRKSCMYVSGQDIFQMIEAEDTNKALERLRAVLSVCGAFKSVFFEYKGRSAKEASNNEWKFQSQAIFDRLDEFMERVHDILDLTQTIQQFYKLSKLEIGGTKGKILSNSVQQVFADFQAAVTAVHRPGYDIMEIDNRSFEDDYYQFRITIKELDRRLASILLQGFADCSSMMMVFKLLDVFEGLTERPIIAAELEKKHAELVGAYIKDLDAVRNLFLSRKEKPPVNRNLPPTAGALAWSRALKERVQVPMEKLKALGKLEREETREAVKKYTDLLASLADYEQDIIEQWSRSVEESSQEKLKLPLLLRNEETGMLSMNFDPALIRLLREVKYFLFFNLQVPETAMSIHRKAEMLRRQMGNLDLIVQMYNGMHGSLLPVERPLVRNHLEKIEKVLIKGLRSLNWKSPGIDQFINEAMAVVRDATTVVNAVKQTSAQVVEILEGWRGGVLLERKSKAMSVEEFELVQQPIRAAKYALIRTGGNEIHRLMRDTNQLLKVSYGLPEWRAYVDYINTIVISGLAKVLITSLESLNVELDPELIKAEEKTPLLEVELDLLGKEVVFQPPIGHRAEKTGVSDIVMHWVDKFTEIAVQFVRLDTGDGSYVKELREHPEVRSLLAKVTDNLTFMETECNQYRAKFLKYEYLWTTDLSAMFTSFLQGAWREETASSGFKMRFLDLHKFEAKIQHYLAVQQEIAELKSSMDVTFLRLNSQPIKQALGTWATKWSFVFTQHLQEFVQSRLVEIDCFIQNTNSGIAEPVKHNDKEALIKCVTHIRDVKKRMGTMELSLKHLRDVVQVLKSQDISMENTFIGAESVVAYLDHAPQRWEQTVSATFKKKEMTQAIRHDMAEHVKIEITEFHSEISDFRSAFRHKAPITVQEAEEAYRTIDKMMLTVSALEHRAVEYSNLEELFELAPSKYDNVEATRKDLQALKTIWDFMSLVRQTFAEWHSQPWGQIQTDQYWMEAKQLEDQSRKIPQDFRDFEVCQWVEDSIRNMLAVLPVIRELRKPVIKDRHWKALSSITRKQIDRGPAFCLLDILNAGIHSHVDEVMEVVDIATKEQRIEGKLSEIEGIWSTLNLAFIPYEDSDSYCLKAPSDIVEMLEEHQLQLQSISGMGKCMIFFRDKVLLWQGKLEKVDTNLKLWVKAQKQWENLASIFIRSADIQEQLPEDSKRFESVDKEFSTLIREARQKPLALECCSKDSLERQLKHMITEQDKCQKALEEYLRKKKHVFPRFYFVAPSSLLTILSNSNNPPKVLPFIGDCFEGIDTLELHRGLQLRDQSESKAPMIPRLAVAMISKDSEKVAFPSPLELEGAVESWLNDVVEIMRETLKNTLQIAMETSASTEVNDPSGFPPGLNYLPSQLLILASQIAWTEETEKAIEGIENGNADAVKKFLELSTKRLEGLVKNVQTELPSALRIKLVSLITVDVHCRDVLQGLVDRKVESSQDFMWQSQLRYYYRNQKKEVEIKICDYRTLYSYEYIGNTGRLVITPLTDRCYITLTTALRLFLGGAPSGPAGTGKTETTKDLARGVGLPCYVFNCSDQMNYQTMGEIFKGLAQTGAWGCFDEFNRIPIEVLSVVTTQVRTVLDAIQFLSVPSNREEEYQKEPAGCPPVVVGKFDFFEERIALVPTAGLFITMNPGYAGRTELPENLKALFRPCAMIRPDMKAIVENMLLSSGFLKAKSLAIKFITLFDLASDMLSQQIHYDWGLRSVKTVVTAAGALKRMCPDYSEEQVIHQAIKDYNCSRLATKDLPIFQQLTADIFPGTQQRSKNNDAIRTACLAACGQKMLQPDEPFIAKVLQYNDLLSVRHSVVLLGPAGSGKTTVWQLLCEAKNNDLPRAVAVYDIINPKAISSDELFGYMTLDKDWKDGVLSMAMRSMSKEWGVYSSTQASKWIVLDGEIDPEWIESLNTVMDDNKVLTLVSNERIPLTPSMRMIFEVDSLAHATPATVSRAGILFINENDIGWQPFVESWIERRPSASEKDILPGLFAKYVEKTLSLIRRDKLEYVTETRNITLVMNLCYLLEGLLSSVKDVLGKEKAMSTEVVETVFAFAVVWALGGSLQKDKTNRSMDIFSNAWMTEFKPPKIPDSCGVFECFYDVQKNEMMPWSARVPSYSPMVGASFGDVLVPTANSVRTGFLLELAIKCCRPVLFVGDRGSGKSTAISNHLANVGEDWSVQNVNANYYTDSLSLQLQLEGMLEKRTGRLYGPARGKKLIVFIDECNMPATDKYGTQTTSSFLRQYFDYGCWYDRDDLSLKKQIIDMQIIGCMNPKSGPSSLNERFLRHFWTIHLTPPDSTDLRTMYTAILGQFLDSFSQPVRALIPTIINATLELHSRIAEEFLPSGPRYHYIFTLRDLRNVFQGVCQALPEYYVQPIKLLRLWIHECHRVYSDRLISHNEVTIFSDVLVDVTKKHFEESQAQLHQPPLLFANFVMDQELGRPYVSVSTMDEMRLIVNAKMAEYNENQAVMNLVLFDQAVEQLVRITRVLGSPNGQALLIGVGGSGKQSLCRLASFICQYGVFELTSFSESDPANLMKEAVKELYHRAGVRPAVPITFLVNLQSLPDEKSLTFINDLLHGAFNANIFTKDEMEDILSTLRVEAKRAGLPETREHVQQFFVERVCRNIHTILLGSPVGEILRLCIRRFPAIASRTVINWFHPWPSDALKSVATRFLSTVEMTSEILKENISHHIAEVHVTAIAMTERYRRATNRHSYVTPKCFLDLLDMYNRFVSEKSLENRNQRQRLEGGLEALTKASADVELLQEELKVAGARVEEKKKATEDLLKEMGKQRSEMEKKQVEADDERRKAAQAASAAKKLEDEAAADLAISQPALDAAKTAVDCLSKASITELKSMGKPPAGVDRVTQALLIMIKGEKKNFSWDNAKKMMAKVDAFKQQLESYNGETISSETLDLLEPIISEPNFTPDKMKSKSVAAASLCTWVINIVAFHKTFVKVKPLIDKLTVAKHEKGMADEALAKVEGVLGQIESELSQLQAAFREATNEKARMEAEANNTQDKLTRAERLVTGLSSERERWSNDIERLKSEMSTLYGDALLAAGFVAYSGAFDANFRQQLWKEVWIPDMRAREIPLKDAIDPLHILASEATITDWMNDGLPSDRISAENAAIISRCNRWPLLIDPQLQALKWLRAQARRRSGEDRMTIVQTTQSGWLRQLVTAVREGEFIVIENVAEDLPKSLQNILSRSLSKKGRSFFIRIVDEDVEYDPNFRLLLQTKLSNPHYSPEISSQCTLINFIVTEQGLEDQLLTHVVAKEQPELEKEKQDLQTSIRGYRSQIGELATQLLEKLSNAPADILSDASLVESVDATKRTAEEIKEAEAKGKETDQILNRTRELYRPVAAEGSMLYFLLVGLSSLSPMYHYSLASFLKLFFLSLKAEISSSAVEERVTIRQEHLRYTVYKAVNRGLFAGHKMNFLSQMTFKLLEKAHLGKDTGFSSEALRVLLRKPRSFKALSAPNPVDWLTLDQWAAIVGLSEELPEFTKLALDIEENAVRFKEWFVQPAAEAEKLPLDWRELDRTPFLKLLVVNCLRPDRLISALQDFIVSQLPDGKQYLEIDAELNSYQVLEQAFADTDAVTPIFFVLSPGSDVNPNIDKLAMKRGMEKNVTYFSISLGQGQESVAMKLVEDGCSRGHWVALHNIHLTPRWLTALDQMLQRLHGGECHANFRLFLSSDPSSSVPVNLLQNSFKITTEPPIGLKANVKRAFSQFSKEQTDDMEQRTRGILFGLCYFHAIVVERSKFGPKGFNVAYHFAVNDLIHSANILANQMETATAQVPWEVLRYIIGDIMYGGHIVNEFDRLVCAKYLDYFFKEELLDEGPLLPYAEGGKDDSFHAPSTAHHFDKIMDHIETNLKPDTTTLALGLHSNSEIGFRTDMAERLFRSIVELQSSDRDVSDGDDSKETIASNKLQDIMDRYREVNFDVEGLRSTLTEVTPYQVVFLQECGRMKLLLNNMIKSLMELDSALKGDSLMTESLETMVVELYADRVPTAWIACSYPSARALASWTADLDDRVSQLKFWYENPNETPKSTWISGLFLPQAFLHAVVQSASQRMNVEIDKLSLETQVTKKLLEGLDEPSRDGAMIHGLYVEGARWDINAGTLENATPRELYCPMPVINLRVVKLSGHMEPGNVYKCPVYRTRLRGNTYVFTASLKTRSPPAKWILAGAALLFDIV